VVSLLLAAIAGLTPGMSGCPGPLNSGFTRVVVDSSSTGGATAVAAIPLSASTLWSLVSVWRDDGMVRLHIPQQSGSAVTWTNVTLLQGGLATGAASVAVADIDKDNRWDILVGTSEGHLVYLHQAGADPANPANWAASAITAADVPGLTSWRSLAIADVDGDGTVEVLGGSGSPGQVHLLDPPPGATNGNGWTRVTIDGNTDAVVQLQAVDVDGDGDIDLLSLTEGEALDNVSWYSNPGPGDALVKSWNHYPIGSAGMAAAMAFADLDNDGFRDVVVAHRPPNSLTWFKGPSSQTDLLDAGKHWSSGLLASLESDAGGAVEAVDLDADGETEVIVGTYSGRLLEFRRAGAIWTKKVLDQGAGVIFGMSYVDMDNDGKVDLVAATMDDSATAGRVLWYRQE
jgi:hypothetical protein